MRGCERNLSRSALTMPAQSVFLMGFIDGSAKQVFEDVKVDPAILECGREQSLKRVDVGRDDVSALGLGIVRREFLHGFLRSKLHLRRGTRSLQALNFEI